MGERKYIVTASQVTPGHLKGEIHPASAFGDRLEKHLRTGAIEEYVEPRDDDTDEGDGVRIMPEPTAPRKRERG